MITKKIAGLLLVFVLIFAVSCGDKDTSIGGGGGGYRGPQLPDDPLKDTYKDYFLIGNIINSTYMTGRHFELLTEHYNTVTCENDMKPDALAPSSNGGSYRFSTADAQVQAMLDAKMKVHGHTLVWHSQTPGWLTSSNAEANMKKYITDVMAHFKGKVTSWDVVNEAMKDQGLSNYQDQIFNQGKWKEYLRNTTDSDNDGSPWYQAIGDSYIYTAFKTARATDPAAVLYYNDFGLNGTYKPRAVYNMIKEINEDWKNDNDNTDKSRKLIEGIGMQGHYNTSWMNTEDGFNRLKGNIEKYLELGIRVDISELDIAVGSDAQGTGQNTSMSSSDAEAQAKAYAKLFKTLKELNEQYPGQITRVTMWGIDDKTSWKSKGNPCLFDGSLNPKPAFYAVSNPAKYSN